MQHTETGRAVHISTAPAHHEGHLLVGDLERGAGVLDPEGAFHPLTVREEERPPYGYSVQIFSVDGCEGDTPERAMRAFAERAR